MAPIGCLKITLSPRRNADFYVFLHAYVYMHLRCHLGVLWEGLGGLFWLKSRLKIGQDVPRPLLKNFWGSLWPLPGLFGRASDPFPGLRSREWQRAGPQEAPREPQMTPQGGANRPQRGPEKASKEVGKTDKQRHNNKIAST